MREQNVGFLPSAPLAPKHYFSKKFILACRRWRGQSPGRSSQYGIVKQVTSETVHLQRRPLCPLCLWSARLSLVDLMNRKEFILSIAHSIDSQASADRSNSIGEASEGESASRTKANPFQRRYT